MRSYSNKFNWFKDNSVLPNTSGIVKQATFIRLEFASLKVEDSGVYKCNITDNDTIQEKTFHLIVFGK